MLTLLLPAAERLRGQRLDADLALRLARADRPAAGEPGYLAQLRRQFDVAPWPPPIAALTRQHDAGDAAHHAWLRADPAYVRIDINAGRMLACGETLQIAADEAQDLLRPLKPLFGDAGFPLSAPHPARWYLRLPREARIPAFASPDDVLGDDLFEHLPDGTDARRWRSLMSEAQVVLHNHPRNQARVERGLPPVNSLWFWGGGLLPDRVGSTLAWVRSGDAELLALAAAAGVRVDPGGDIPAGDGLIDLRGVRDVAALAGEWLRPALDALDAGRLDALALDLADGGRLRLTRAQRWRLWRRRPFAFAA
ncbi:phosphoglycerate mutase [Coralloluteibacterium stylophorae]|uniref:Phosphoglycerate mutase n=1 Tax=Coralloluteibacterium stylophorae TaxID=1776034 RepID=A0AAP2FWV4_9GAMM|nr:phosphoglycerate mutase [Coralloluteibacterium stylophorae]MBS7455927.1 phosphoglycerate mutase [Coralloluteibacterium stylophorae]